MIMKKSWWLGRFEITMHEILVSITIIAVMMILGFVFSGKIEENQTDKNAEYYKAAKITESEMFQYGMDTGIGNAFVYGSLEPMDSVTYPEIGGQYMFVEKVEEHYNRYEEEVTKKDSNGKEYKEKEVYYRWDIEDRESQNAKEIKFSGVAFPYGKINLPRPEYIETISGGKVWSWNSGEYVKVRFKYYGCQGPYIGTVYSDLMDNTIANSSPFYDGQTIDETVDSLTPNVGVWIFWIFWIILTCGVVIGFFYLDNRWLED